MKLLNNRILLTEVKVENPWGVEDKEALKLGTVAFPCTGTIDEETVSFKKNDEIYYQYGSIVKIDNIEYTLIRASDIVCLK